MDTKNNDLLDVSNLINAINSLESALNIYHRYDDKSDEELRKILRAGVIKIFEFTYEICWKFMKRWLEQNVSSDSLDGTTRKELFRQAAENKLISDVETWFSFHRARNETSHIYDLPTAENVFTVTQDFLPYAKDFRDKLEQRL
ncbi:MAG: nucleotidyltransferase substrate binding protein [Planctomycetaceae bacterium]|jgi:nucleotidyltransferase substrate binding protein (TIGR01987 family)|nr:nucleotidyltransferase substrate binding protein [Planctomycetaceae bacterium]